MTSGTVIGVWIRAAAIAAISLAGIVVAARAQDPKVPAGIDPGGIPIAVLTTGIDYTDPAIAMRLARDGEGELIGWDFSGNDRRPFPAAPNDTPPNWGGDGTALIRRFLASPGSGGHSIVPVRINPSDLPSLGKALMFVSQTNTTTVVLPMGSETLSDWEGFRLGAARFANLVVLVPECAPGTGVRWVYPASLGLPNVRLVTAASASPGSLAAAVLETCPRPAATAK